jgi:4-diphosphocytidyl-2-C-methyl-D-erythritol kinase
MLATAGGSGTVHLAPAKLNLYLEVLARRQDGYHDVETLMVPVSLYDTLVFNNEPGNEDQPGAIHFALTCSRHDGVAVPADDENLVVRALKLLQRKSGTASGARVRLVKRIPADAGLGGGSSDAAAALLAANRAWGIDWQTDRLVEVASELGSDVPFFLLRSPAIGRGRGERLERLAQIGDLHAVIVCPPVGLSTPSVYRDCCVPERPCDMEPLLGGLRSGSSRLIKKGLHNRLQEAAQKLTPWIDRLRSEFELVDCPAHQMTGSGSSYFGICRHARHAKQVAVRLRGRKLGNVFTVRRAY